MKRRNFLKAAGVGAAATAASGLAAPAIAQERFRWKMLTTWPKNLPAIGIGAQRIADSITAMSEGRLTVKLYAAGELVPAFEAFDAVRDGVAECCHDAPYYWIAKHGAMPFFCSVPGGLSPQEHNAWIYYGGGQELWDELYGQFGLRGFLAGTGGPNMGGWYRKPIDSIEEMRGLKMRIPGLGAEVFNRLGVISVNLAAGEVLPSLQTGALDAAEWAGPYNDLAMGFPQGGEILLRPRHSRARSGSRADRQQQGVRCPAERSPGNRPQGVWRGEYADARRDLGRQRDRARHADQQARRRCPPFPPTR